MISIFILLCGIIIAQQIYFMHHIQKLINKLMSRSFYDFKVTEQYKPREKKLPVVEAEIPSTTGALQGLF